MPYSFSFPAAGRAAFLSAAIGAASLGAAEVAPRKADYPPPVAPASEEAEQAMKRFRLPKGLKVELAAAEPHLANPVAFTVDEQGRFFVVETFRLHAGVTDIRSHMDWLDEELAVKTVEERVAYMTKHEGKRIADYTQQSDRLRLVWDSDGDGRADRATVFADGFNGVAEGIASGVLARRGDVYFANIPNLWLLRDADGDGRADSKQALSSGYGVRVGFLGHDLHGLCWGPDGRLYFSIGDRGAHVRTKEGKLIELPETGAVFRCDPDGANLELFATGLRNPQELAFDALGNLWTGDNNSDGGDPARWVYVVEGGDSGWRIGWQFINSPNARGPWLAERMCYPRFEGQAAYILPPLANIGNGPSGLAYHPGTGLNENFRDRFFLCDFRGGTGSGIHSIRVRPKGAGYEVAERSDFIWDVLVTDGDFGYDGCFYLTDWVNGWNQTGKGRIYRVFDPATRNSPLHAEVQRLFAEGFAQRNVGELAVLLGHADRRVRQEAQFALVNRGSPGMEILIGEAHRTAQATGGGSPVGLARLHGVWGLGQIVRLASSSVAPFTPPLSGMDQRLAPTQAATAEIALATLAEDTDPEVRGQAIQALADARSPRVWPVALNSLAKPEPRPRYFAALALSKLGRPEAVPAVLEMLRVNDNQDLYLRHAGILALAACADAPTLASLATNASVGVRLAAVVALRRQSRAEVAAFLQDADATVVLEAARAINDLPIPGALPRLAALLTDAEALARQQFAAQQQRQRAASASNPQAPKPDDEPDVLFAPLLRRVVNAHFRLGASANAAALVAFANSGIGSSAVRAEAVSVLGDWAKPSGRDNVTGLWRPPGPRDGSAAGAALREKIDPLLQNPSGTVGLAALKVATKLGIKEGATAALALVTDAKRPANVRVEALRALAAFKAPRLGDALKAAAEDAEETLRNEATRIQAQLRPGDATVKLKTTLGRGTPGEKQAAFSTLATVPGAAADALFAQWLDKLLAKQVPAELQLDLLDAAGKRPAREVKDRLTKFERSRPSDDDLRSYRECLSGGNLEEGRKIFLERQEVSCVRCHKAGAEGGEVGPDLAGLGSRQSREYLLESIVYPNKHIAPGFDNVTLTMKDGAFHAGLLKSETDTEVEVNSPEDGVLRLKKSDIQARQRGLSSMPEELRQVLSKQDLRNLVEFLGSLK